MHTSGEGTDLDFRAARRVSPGRVKAVVLAGVLGAAVEELELLVLEMLLVQPLLELASL